MLREEAVRDEDDRMSWLLHKKESLYISILLSMKILKDTVYTNLAAFRQCLGQRRRIGACYRVKHMRSPKLPFKKIKESRTRFQTRRTKFGQQNTSEAAGVKVSVDSIHHNKVNLTRGKGSCCFNMLTTLPCLHLVLQVAESLRTKSSAREVRDG